MYAGLCLHCIWNFCDHSHSQIQAYRERRQPGRLSRLLGHKRHWQIWVRSTPPLQHLGLCMCCHLWLANVVLLVLPWRCCICSLNATTASSASYSKYVSIHLTLMWCMQLCRIAIFGLAFLIATITQLQAAFTRNFHYDMKDDLPRWFMWILVVTGRLPPQCCFQLVMYNLSQTDLSTASCVCEGATTMSAFKQFVQSPSCHCSALYLSYLCSSS